MVPSQADDAALPTEDSEREDATFEAILREKSPTLETTPPTPLAISFPVSQRAVPNSYVLSPR